jgi:iron-sulfur cluster assembly accessory protein
MDLRDDIVIAPITLTQTAVKAVKEIINHKNLKGYALRLYLTGGGCSGYQYNLALDSRHRAEDTVFETDGIKLVVDEVSIKYLQGATVDYVEGSNASGFTINNPNPISSCNCGQNTETSPNGSSSPCAGCA